MGLFGGKEVFVSSVVYNMAGGIEDRIDFLKSVVVGSVIGNTGFSMAECLTGSYLSGPGIKIRSFYRWTKATGNYDTVGVPTTTIYSPNYNITTIQSQIPVSGGNTAKIQVIKYGAAEANFWADQYVMLNHQSLYKSSWTADYNATTNQITITWQVGYTPGSPTTTFTPSINFGAKYYYVTYGLSNSSGGYIGARMWIYEMGSGNASMDVLQSNSAVSGDFVPFIPIRIKNNFLSGTYKPTVYAQAVKAYKKASGGKKLSKLVEQIEINDDLEDIDHCYLVYGVSLNTMDNKARRYLFNFFDFMRTASLSSETEYDAYLTNRSNWWSVYGSTYNTKAAYLINNPEGDFGGDTDFGSIEGAPPEPLNEIEIKSTGSVDCKLHMIIKWTSIKKTSGGGMAAPSGQVGELWWDATTFLSGNSGAVSLINAILNQNDEYGKVALNWQKTATTWEKITIVGLRHRNEIYDGKAVKISAAQALVDADESGFIVPLHYQTMREMSLIDSTQMMTSAAYLVFNCYEVVKQKWYQTWAFKIFIFIVVIVVCVVFPPLGGPMAAGLLGTAAGVGAALGFTGLMAAIVGAIANAIAAMILMQIIAKASVAVFGAKLGMIIATIASFVAMSFGAPMMNGASMAQAWGNMMSAVNLIGLTSAVGNGVSGYLNASTQQWAAKTEKLMAEYEHASNAITRQWFEQFGYGNFAFDPNQLTNNNPDGLTELPQMFLDRTLMTGSDIADLSLSMITDFAKMTLAPPTMGS